MSSSKTIPFPLQTARFKLVVQRAGRPDVHLSLVPPERDPELQRLARQSRVMTVHQARRGTGADYGMVGIFPERGAQLLVFRKSLRRFAGKRIVGIDYSLLTGATEVTGKAPAEPRRATNHGARSRKTTDNKRQLPPKEAVPEPPAPTEPPTMSQVWQRLQAIKRLMGARKYALAKAEVGALARDVRAGLEPVPFVESP